MSRLSLGVGWGNEAFFSLYSVCTFPVFHALPRTYELPSNMLFFSSFLQGRDAVSDPSAIAPQQTLVCELFVSVNSPFLSASPERNYGSCLFANFQHRSDLEPSGLLPEVHTAVNLSILKHTDHTPLY